MVIIVTMMKYREATYRSYMLVFSNPKTVTQVSPPLLFCLYSARKCHMHAKMWAVMKMAKISTARLTICGLMRRLISVSFIFMTRRSLNTRNSRRERTTLSAPMLDPPEAM
jgi:hypothetical protein